MASSVADESVVYQWIISESFYDHYQIQASKMIEKMGITNNNKNQWQVIHGPSNLNLTWEQGDSIFYFGPDGNSPARIMMKEPLKFLMSHGYNYMELDENVKKIRFVVYPTKSSISIYFTPRDLELNRSKELQAGKGKVFDRIISQYNKDSQSSNSLLALIPIIKSLQSTFHIEEKELFGESNDDTKSDQESYKKEIRQSLHTLKFDQLENYQSALSFQFNLPKNKFDTNFTLKFILFDIKSKQKLWIFNKYNQSLLSQRGQINVPFLIPKFRNSSDSKYFNVFLDFGRNRVDSKFPIGENLRVFKSDGSVSDDDNAFKNITGILEEHLTSKIQSPVLRRIKRSQRKYGYVNMDLVLFLIITDGEIYLTKNFPPTDKSDFIGQEQLIYLYNDSVSDLGESEIFYDVPFVILRQSNFRSGLEEIIEDIFKRYYRYRSGEGRKDVSYG